MRGGSALRNGLFLFLIVLASTFAVLSQMNHGRSDSSPKTNESRAADRRAIEQVLRDQQEAWNRADVEKFLEGYWHSPELTFSGSGGVQRGWDAVLARYKRNYPSREAMGQLDFSDLEFRFFGSGAALILGRWHLTRPPNNDVGGVFSLVLQKFPEGWRIIHDHTSAVAPAR
jgi:uncharacterized protein (TIGR02246 family)